MREERVHREAHKRSALLFHFHIHHDIYKLLQQSVNRPEEGEKEEERGGGEEEEQGSRYPHQLLTLNRWGRPR